MTQELIPASQVRDASDMARIQQILRVTARYFGIEAFPFPERRKESFRPRPNGPKAHTVSPKFENMQT